MGEGVAGPKKRVERRPYGSTDFARYVRIWIALDLGKVCKCESFTNLEDFRVECKPNGSRLDHHRIALSAAEHGRHKPRH
jgi:hypothetical protein